MALNRGEPVDVPAHVARRAQRALRTLDLIEDLDVLRNVPIFAGAALSEHERCVVQLEPGWTLTFDWRGDHAWSVRVVES